MRWQLKRIRQARDFRLIFQSKPLRLQHFAIYTLKNDTGHARLGLAISKRFCKRATSRHAIKRVAREAFTAHILTENNIDVVLRLFRPIDDKLLSHKQLKRLCRAELTALLQTGF